jgi:multicomponent Na+:H+ antiporter subunit F
MNAAIWISAVLLIVAAALAVARALRPGSLGDRAVALDMFTAVFICGLLVAAAGGDSLYLDLALVLGLLGFVTSVTVALFVERRGR